MQLVFPQADRSEMNWTADCAAVIPCFNEAAQIHKVVVETRRYVPDIIVVDDGSTDATAGIARDAGAEVLKMTRNCGKGFALRQGWRRAHELGCGWVLLLDGDGQHAAGDIPGFFRHAEKTGAGMVVGNRMGDCGSMPQVRRIANRLMSRVLSGLTHKHLPDSQCGFRLVHLASLMSLQIHANRFEIESSMLVAFLHAGRRVEFIPVQTIYNANKSKIRPVTDSWRWLRWCAAQRVFLRACRTMRAPQ